ncbi:HNH endonuclease [Haladaptatus sp. YSMS36]|uniref:HNH endonuclease n=1 Tax=Haladaptatus sp. YSMS36 TaxID=3033384 RepID=UPI0023E8C081|nr:HNH endonuclease [Haladaptatus sp. YSMS36]
MTADRLRSIVPMFGGATQYVETLNTTLAFVDSYHPTTDELVAWHQETFANVSSRSSIMRRMGYLTNLGFLQRDGEVWRLGAVGHEYTQNHDTATLFQVMSDRNVGLRSLLYALAVAPMTISEIGDQQLDTHPELGWRRGETDMALQRANWLRSMGLVEKQGDTYDLTREGRSFVEDAVETWAAPTEVTPVENGMMTAGTYETVTYARAVDPEFRATALARYDQQCPISGVDHPGLLDVAHVLSWRDYPTYRADLSNVITLSKTHHAAFDRELYTIDADFRLLVNSTFETQSDLLKRTILNKAGETLPLLETGLSSDHLAQHNAGLEWV